ncbi:MAG: RluA family pseudouridine synthase [Acidiferrobacterales bacterium]
MKVSWFDISEDNDGQRLDNFLVSRLKGVPKSRIYRLVRKGEVRVNKGRKRPEYRLKTGDIVRIPPISRPEQVIQHRDKADLDWLDDRVLYEDKQIIALDKPSGMAVHGGSGISLGLIEAMRSLRGQNRFLELVHRLDRDTSGCILLAKRRSALVALHAQLQAHKVDKRYLALIKGNWQGGTKKVSANLERLSGPNGERMVRVSEAGKSAISFIKPVQQFSGYTLVEIQLKTGRTHQARVHCAHLSQPIAGDERYGDPETNKKLKGIGLKRLFLHAASIEFSVNENENKKIKVSAPLPPELKKVIKKLE